VRIGALVRNADLAHDCHFARRPGSRVDSSPEPLV
jgi:hypothetical protein